MVCRIIGILLLTTIAGCSSGSKMLVKPDLTIEGYKRDYYACRYEDPHEYGGALVPRRYESFLKCMKAKGYRMVPTNTPREKW